MKTLCTVLILLAVMAAGMSVGPATAQDEGQMLDINAIPIDDRLRFLKDFVRAQAASYSAADRAKLKQALTELANEF